MRRCEEEAEPIHRFLKATTLTPVVLCFFTNPFLVSVIALCVAPRLENVFSGVNCNAGITVINIWLPVHPVPATHLELWSNADRIQNSSLICQSKQTKVLVSAGSLTPQLVTFHPTISKFFPGLYSSVQSKSQRWISGSVAVASMWQWSSVTQEMRFKIKTMCWVFFNSTSEDKHKNSFIVYSWLCWWRH